MTRFDANLPIYLQLMDQIKSEIVSGKLKPNDQVETVREMALKFGVNPNTIQRALQELEREGLLKSERTTGRFICATDKMIVELKEKQGKEKTRHFIADMMNLGYAHDEIVKLVKKAKGEQE